MTRVDHGPDAGFTVAELSITMALLGVVMSALLGLLTGQATLERRVSAFADNQESIREALVFVQRDLRSAEPLVQLSSPLDYRWRVDLKVFLRVTDPEPVIVRWRIAPDTAPAGDELVREIVRPDGTITTTYRLRGVRTQREARHLFQYFKRDGTAFDLDDTAGTTTGTMVACTVRLKIDLTAAPHGKPTQAPRLISDVQLRNWVPGAVGCP